MEYPHSRTDAGGAADEAEASAQPAGATVSLAAAVTPTTRWPCRQWRAVQPLSCSVGSACSAPTRALSPSSGASLCAKSTSAAAIDAGWPYASLRDT